MRNSLLIISLITIFGAASAFGQNYGIRVEANIPFDFTIGKTNFASGNYELLVTRHINSLYSVSILDSDGKVVMRTTAVRNGSTNRENSDMVFAANAGGHFLDKLRTPEMGLQFAYSKTDKLVAQTKKVPVETSSGPNF
jgi:hypothetical protein